jgi:glycosyltransferase involved in cell wall biosynthesis
MNNITVSVIMITYRHELYIIHAIEGVRIQNCNFNVELLIADDNSPDGTKNKVEDYLNSADIPKNIDIKYFQHEKNKGPNNNYLWASKKAKGKYIANCEGDDYWIDPYKLQRQVDVLEANPDLAMCTHEASHQSTLVDNEKNLRRFLSIFVRDIQLYGFKRVIYLSYLLAVNRQQFWRQKRTHDKHKRKIISKLEDFKLNKWYMPMCSILMRSDFIDEIVYCISKSDGGHQLTLLMGAMNGGIYHFKEIMSVKMDQETSISKDKSRLKTIKERDKNPQKNNRIKRFKALQECAKNPEQVQILQGMIDRELKRTKDNY